MHRELTHNINPTALGIIITERIPAAAESIPCPGQTGPERDSIREAELKAAEAVDEERNEEDDIDVRVAPSVIRNSVKDVIVVPGCAMVVTGIVVVKTRVLAPSEGSGIDDVGVDSGMDIWVGDTDVL